MQVRARGIVDQHQRVVAGSDGKRPQRRQHRIGALGTTNAMQDRLAAPLVPTGPTHIVGSQRDHRAGHVRMRQQRLERVCDQRLTGGFEVLLGNVATKSRAAAGRRDHRPDGRRGHGASPSVGASAGGGVTPSGSTTR